ncbi:MAG: helix-turn-helix transcriptional regulator [Nitrospinota bacterium]|nr:helix-turn-helix transcriptional regulator [Nitrospinota bacterium]
MGTIGTRLKTWRKNKGLSDMTELGDVAQGKLSDLENDNALPSAQTLINFAECTDVDIHWLLMEKSYKGR